MVAVVGDLDPDGLGGLEDGGSRGDRHLLAIDGQGDGVRTLLIGS